MSIAGLNDAIASTQGNDLTKFRQAITDFKKTIFSLDEDDPRKDSKWFGLSPLMVAAGFGRSDLVQELITAGASVNHVNLRYESAIGARNALWCAVTNGHLETVKLLCKAGAQADSLALYPNSTYYDNDSALAQREYDESKKTPLFQAITLAKSNPKLGLELVKTLGGVNADDKSKESKDQPSMPLHSLELAFLFAVDFQLPDIVAALIKLGVSPAKLHYHYIFDPQRFPKPEALVLDKTPVLAHAVLLGNLNIVRQLIVEDKDFADKNDAKGNLCIQIAIEQFSTRGSQDHQKIIFEFRRAGISFTPPSRGIARKTDNLLMDALRALDPVPALKALCGPIPEDKTSPFSTNAPSTPPQAVLSEALCKAAQRGSTIGVKELLDAKADPNHKSANEKYPRAIHKAIMFGEPAIAVENIVRALRLNGAEVDLSVFKLIFDLSGDKRANRTEDDFNALIHAVCEPEKPSISKRSESKISGGKELKTADLTSLGITNSSSKAPLITTEVLQNALVIAAEKNLQVFVAYLIKLLKQRKHSNPELLIDPELLNKAFKAAFTQTEPVCVLDFFQTEFQTKGKYPFVDMNLAKGEITHKPITYAAIAARYGYIDFLLKGGATVEQKDSEGRTILHIAAEHGADVEWILKHTKGKVDFLDNAGQTPLFYALHHSQNGVEKEARTSVVKALLEKKPNVNHKDKKGRTPLRAAFEQITQGNKIHAEVIILLFDAGAKIFTSHDPEKPTLLQILAERALTLTEYDWIFSQAAILNLADRLIPFTDLNKFPIDIESHPLTLIGYIAAQKSHYSLQLTTHLLNSANKGMTKPGELIDRETMREVLMVSLDSKSGHFRTKEITDLLKQVHDKELLKEVSKQLKLKGEKQKAVETRVGQLSEADKLRNSQLDKEEKRVRVAIKTHQTFIETRAKNKAKKPNKTNAEASMVSPALKGLNEETGRKEFKASLTVEKSLESDAKAIDSEFSETKIVRTLNCIDNDHKKKEFLTGIINNCPPHQFKDLTHSCLLDMLKLAFELDTLYKSSNDEQPSLTIQLWNKLENVARYDVFFLSIDKDDSFLCYFLQTSVYSNDEIIANALLQKYLILAPKTFMDGFRHSSNIDPLLQMQIKGMQDTFMNATVLDVYFYLRQHRIKGYSRSLDCYKEEIEAQRDRALIEIGRLITGKDDGQRESGAWAIDILDVIAVCAKITRGKNLPGGSYHYSDLLNALMLPNTSKTYNTSQDQTEDSKAQNQVNGQMTQVQPTQTNLESKGEKAQSDLESKLQTSQIQISLQKPLESKDPEPRVLSSRQILILDLTNQWTQLMKFLETRFPGDYQDLMNWLDGKYPTESDQITYQPVLKPAPTAPLKTSAGQTPVVMSNPTTGQQPIVGNNKV